MISIGIYRVLKNIARSISCEIRNLSYSILLFEELKKKHFGNTSNNDLIQKEKKNEIRLLFCFLSVFAFFAE